MLFIQRRGETQGKLGVGLREGRKARGKWPRGRGNGLRKPTFRTRCPAVPAVPARKSFPRVGEPCPLQTSGPPLEQACGMTGLGTGSLGPFPWPQAFTFAVACPLPLFSPPFHYTGDNIIHVLHL